MQRRANLRKMMQKGTRLAFIAAAFTLCGCDADTSGKSQQNHSSIYDPMKDAAPGDAVPTAPSISSVSPGQEMGNGNSGGVGNSDPTGAASLGALDGGRR